MSEDALDPFFGESFREAAPPAAAPPRRGGGRRRSATWEPGPGGPLEPVEVLQRRSCHFKRKPDGKRGCARCGAAKKDLAHLGAPGSFNAFGSSANPHVWQAVKHQWQEVFSRLLTEAGLPKGLGRVVAEGQVCFGDQTARDQGNFRIVLEKALGDALVEGGWLWDDDWTRYEFGGLALEYVPRENWTRLMLFPSWPAAAGG